MITKIPSATVIMFMLAGIPWPAMAATNPPVRPVVRALATLEQACRSGPPEQVDQAKICTRIVAAAMPFMPMAGNPKPPYMNQGSRAMFATVATIR